MDKKESLKYWGYSRESVDLKSGIAAQVEKIKQYANAMNVELVGIYDENNTSGYGKRPKFEKMWAKLDEVDGIIVTSLDRFGRNFSNIITNVEQLKEKGKHLICLREMVDTRNKESEFFLKMFALFAEYERTLIRERLLAGLNRARIKGSKTGKPCHRPRIEIDWPTFNVWKSKGLSIASIAKIMGYSASNLYKKLRLRESPAPYFKTVGIENGQWVGSPGSQNNPQGETS